jgi:predicted regulator of Ras-like GTPase activity (Roadblock/LC7/MglB family)
MSRSAATDDKRADALRDIISGIEGQKGVKGWAVVTQEGLIVEHKMPTRINPHLLAGNAAALAHSAQVVVRQTGAGPLSMMTLEGDRYDLVVVGGDQQLIFLVVAERRTDMRPLTRFLAESASRFYAL